MKLLRKILIVEDVKLLREVYTSYLAEFHVEVLTAEDGEAALEIARREQPDLIIMDRYMPGMDGIASCRAIKAEAAHAHTPVIMATIAAGPEDVTEYLRAGAVDCISKPIDAKAFLAMIKKHLPEIDLRPVRVAESLEMHIVAADRLHPALTGDISVKGAFAVSDLHVAVNDELTFTFLLPGKEVPIEILGRVVWLRKGEGVPGFGIEFCKVIGKGLPLVRLGELKDFVQSKVRN